MRLLLLAAALWAGTAAAADLRMHHSARLLDAAGAPINGPRDLSVRLVDSDLGGTNQLLWSDDFDAVDVADGYVSVELGSGLALPSTVFDDGAPVWVEVQVGTTTLPRQRLGAAPAAAVAHSVILPPPAPGCTPGALAYDAATARVRVCVAGAWSDLPSRAEAECVARAGTWTGSGCTEFVALGCNPCASWDAFVTACTAMSGRHPCVYGEISLALQSLYGQVDTGAATVSGAYYWVAGYQSHADTATHGNQLWYPWNKDSGRTICTSDAAPMFGLFHPTGTNNGANGCHAQHDTSAIGMCCRDWPW
jgi:hypothetical protein